ncbi:MAG: carbohydrate kinase family protein [Anaerolineae bacterium]
MSMEIVVTGSIAYDYLMRFPGKFREHLLAENLAHISVSFLVDHMTRHYGGNGAAISYSMALLGLRPRLMATAGKDFTDYRDWLETAGVNTASVQVLEDVFTASFFANTDEENNQIASFYGGAMFRAHEFTLEQTVPIKPDYVVIAPNDPAAMHLLAAECHQRGIPFMFDPSQQLPRLNPDEVIYNIERCHTLIVNEYEWGMITAKTGLSVVDALKRVKVLIRTLGKKGAEIYANGEHYFIPVFPVPDDQIADPTGVGDAFRSGVLCGMAHGWSWEITGRVASLCAAYVLEKVGTQGHRYTPQQFVERFRSEFDDEGALDSLVKPHPAAV